MLTEREVVISSVVVVTAAMVDVVGPVPTVADI